MATYLDRIAEYHRDRAAADGRDWVARDIAATPLDTRAAFLKETISVIAEVKRQSPSAGAIADVQPDDQARRYIDNGAAAISVLTDEPHFGGSLEDLRRVAATAGGAVPILRKDFTVSENDVLDAAQNGANIVLLIATILSDEELVTLSQVATDAGLQSLFEVHDVNELRRVEAAGATLIGVNQRDLHTFTIDPQRAATVRSEARGDALFVCESGLKSANDVQNAADNGFDGVLIGEALMRAGEGLPELLTTMSSIRKPK